MVELIKITTNQQREIAERIVTQYHSYVPTFKSVGRRIDFLISIDGEICGMIGIGSATYPPCKDVLQYLGITKQEYKSIFNQIANNWRFCLTKSIKNAGTQALKQLRICAKYEWKKKYGDDLKYIITFVGGEHNGAVYRADNWKKIGETSGLPSHKSVSMKWDNSESISQKFVKPTGANKKIIFIKELPNKIVVPNYENPLI